KLIGEKIYDKKYPTNRNGEFLNLFTLPLASPSDPPSSLAWRVCNWPVTPPLPKRPRLQQRLLRPPALRRRGNLSGDASRRTPRLSPGQFRSASATGPTSGSSSKYRRA